MYAYGFDTTTGYVDASRWLAPRVGRPTAATAAEIY
jgi:hypothetical protein